MFEFYFTVSIEAVQKADTSMCMEPAYVSESLKNHKHLTLSYLATVTSH